MKRLLILVMFITSANAAELVPLGFLYPNDFGKYSLGNGVSANGLVAVGYSHSLQSPKQAFRWTQQTGMVGLGFLTTTPGRWSEARAASCDGSVIVGLAQSAQGVQAFRWTEQTGMQPLGFLSLDGTPASSANAVSCDGTVIAGASSTASGVEAYRWTQQTGMVSLGELPGGSWFSRASAISYDGNVIAGFSDSGAQGGPYESFIWTPATGMFAMGDVMGIPVGSYFSRGFGVAGNSTVFTDAVVVGTSSGIQAFRWVWHSGMIGLGFDVPGSYPPGVHSFGSATNADGSVVVGYWGYEQGGLHNRAMIWEQALGMRDIKTAMNPAQTPSVMGWLLEIATGISLSGKVIVGSGKNPMDVYEAWLIRTSPPPPDPIDWEKTLSHIICCWQPPGPDPWHRVLDGSMSGTTKDCAPLVSYDWDFGDGETGSGEIGRHTWREAGTYRVQLTVRDSCRESATDFVEVEIGAEKR